MVKSFAFLIIAGCIASGSGYAQTTQRASDTCDPIPVTPSPNGAPDFSFTNGMGPVGGPDDPSKIDFVCYGKSETWTEYTGKKDANNHPVNTPLIQRFTLWRPAHSEGLPLPLIIWSHPNLEDELIPFDSDPSNSSKYNNIVRPAMDHGFALMSIQFRQPVGSQDYVDSPAAPQNPNKDGGTLAPVAAKPSTDIATTIQFARQVYRKLIIDPDNIFLVGQSRGSLNVLTALMANRQKASLASGDPAYLLQSSKPNAVFAANAQATYDHDEIQNFFIEHKSMATFNDISSSGARQIEYPTCKTSDGYYDYWCFYSKADQPINNLQNNPVSALNALNDPSINLNGTPIWLRYDRDPVLSDATQAARVALYVNNAGDDQGATMIDSNQFCFELMALTCLDVHHPNYGLSLVTRYQALKQTSPTTKTYIYAEYGHASYGPGTVAKKSRDDVGKAFFRDYYCFFLQYQPAGAPVPISTITDDGNDKRIAAINSYNNQRLSGKAESIKKCTLSEGETWPPAQ